jgi:hypothetical protein
VRSTLACFFLAVLSSLSHPWSKQASLRAFLVLRSSDMQVERGSKAQRAGSSYFSSFESRETMLAHPPCCLYTGT